MPRTHPLVGNTAPALSLPNYDGQTYELTPGHDGIPIALFFYPKAGSYGCTKEACEFRDAIAHKEAFKVSKAIVVGISSDPVEKQKEFVERQKLTYPVLSDSKGEARKAYHVGKGLLGFVDARMTFIINGKGVVRDVLDTTVNYGAHVKFVNKWLDKLDYEEKQANAPRQPEPGLITEPALATEDTPHQEIPLATPALATEVKAPSSETPAAAPDPANHDIVQEESAAA